MSSVVIIHFSLYKFFGVRVVSGNREGIGADCVLEISVIIQVVPTKVVLLKLFLLPNLLIEICHN